MNIENKKICLTGTMSKPRKEIIELIEENGAIFSKSLSSACDYLIRGETKQKESYVHISKGSGKETVVKNNGQKKTEKAQKDGKFKNEIVPVILKPENINKGSCTI